MKICSMNFVSRIFANLAMEGKIGASVKYLDSEFSSFSIKNKVALKVFSKEGSTQSETLTMPLYSLSTVMIIDQLEEHEPAVKYG